MKKQMLINMVQSRDTGRFLFKKAGDHWVLPGVVDDSANKAGLFEAIKECSALLGIDVNESENWTIVYGADVGNKQVFITYLSGEPQAVVEHTWAPLFEFPHPIDPLVDKILTSKWLIEYFLNPDT